MHAQHIEVEAKVFQVFVVASSVSQADVMYLKLFKKKKYATLLMFGFDASEGSQGTLSTSHTMNPYSIVADVPKFKRK